MASGMGAGGRRVGSTYTCTQWPTAATASAGSSKIASRNVTLLVPSRVTANPTTSGSGNFNSARYLHPDSATTPSHDTVSGSIPQLVLIHTLIAVSNSALY